MNFVDCPSEVGSLGKVGGVWVVCKGWWGLGCWGRWVGFGWLGDGGFDVGLPA